MSHTLHRLLAAALVLPAAGAFAARSQTVDFSSGTEGWTVAGYSWITPLRGNDRPAWATHQIQTWGASWVDSTDAAFIGDFSGDRNLVFGVDMNALSISFSGMQVSRDVILELRDYDDPAAGMPYTSVWTTLGTIGKGMGWQHFSATIADPTAAALPAGWSGFGAPDDSGLPPGRTFASVLAGVDEIRFTTLVPGWFYDYTNFNVVLDNISVSSVSAVPEPSTAMLALAGLAAGGMLRRRRRGLAAAA